MPNGNFQIPQPKMALRDAARFPAQVLPAGIGRPLSNMLNSATDALPDIALPSNLPTSIPGLPLPQGAQAPPSPKMFVARAETVLPAGAPRISSLIPDVNLPTASAPSFSIGASSANGGRHRPIEKTSTAQSGGVRAGGYRSI